jgi:hypothetical protein
MKIEEAKHLLISMLEVEEAWYNTMLFDLATQWAEQHCGSGDSSKFLTMQPEFWGWWKKQFSTKTMDFLDCIHLDNNLQYYLKINVDGKSYTIYSLEKTKELYIQYMYTSLLSDEGRAILDLHFNGYLKQLINK